jgi:signal transduction histidine kinase
MLERAVENLVTNAVKYSSEGSAVTVSLSPSADGVCIAVHAHGGRVAVESVEGGGTTFTISLPRSR